MSLYCGDQIRRPTCTKYYYCDTVCAVEQCVYELLPVCIIQKQYNALTLKRGQRTERVYNNKTTLNELYNTVCEPVTGLNVIPGQSIFYIYNILPVPTILYSYMLLCATQYNIKIIIKGAVNKRQYVFAGYIMLLITITKL